MKLQQNKDEVTLQVVHPVRSSKKTNGVAKHLNAEAVTKAARSLVPNITPHTVLDGVRQKVFLDRYSLKDAEGNSSEQYIEEMWQRVAGGIAMEEKTLELQKYWAEKFYHAMEDFKFVPGGRILSGGGTGYEVTFFNCYVIPSPPDSRGGIMENITHTVEIQARGGGVGVNLSSLRPRGARVKKVNGTSSGPVNWAALYSTANHDVIQQGGSRRGALMLMLHDWHPDILEFIHVKEDLSKIPGANLSICVSDKFMEAVENDWEWETKFPDLDDPEYDALWDGDIDGWEKMGKAVKVFGRYRARDLWDQICTAAWRSAEPGLHFLERSNKWGNTWYFEKLTSTNPCGEQPLGPWAVCNLGAMNLSAFVKDDGTFDFALLDETVRVAMRFMDNVVDANYYFYKQNEIASKNIRRTGIGTMGLGDALIKMKLRYGSDDAMPVIEKIYKTIRDAAYETSADLAEEKGTFPMYDKEKYLQGHFIKSLPDDIRERIGEKGIRNAVILTQAPTGTTSLLSGVSSGIEPVYDFKFTRRDRIGEHVIYHPLFQEWLDANPDATERPDYFVGANDMSPLDHIKVQALVQKYTDSSISKTANAPENFSVDDVKELYMQAYKLGCKGITFFRDGSRMGVLSHEEKKEEKKEVQPAAPEVDVTPEHRPMVLRGRTYEIVTPVGKAFVTVNRDDNNQPYEVFVTVGRGGMHTMADAEAIGKLASMSLRVAKHNRMEIAKKIVGQLRGIGGASHVGFGKNRIMSLADAIAKVLADEISLIEGEEHSEETVAEQSALPLTTESIENGKDDVMPADQQDLFAASGMVKNADLCPECGAASFVREDGCQKCYSCGYSKC